ncbi:hypothetical protein [Metaclostridioides mangenotii]|uniref:hypothetical protein n=1 Tax=Metaclostridioides mangenotii TaxID=1540 RepID=UPI0026EE2621|nr:hypothetical protein [Clostridioides mangenotii]
MSLIDLKCQESICFSKDCNYINKENENLLLGHSDYCDYLIYLYFDLLPCSFLKDIKQAKLILFKLPPKLRNQIYYRNQCAYYSVYPLMDFFSIYSRCLDIEYSQVVNFEDKHCCSYSEVDITSIVKTWIDEAVENKGLLLTGNIDTRIITYASDRYRIKGMQPRLRLIYEKNYICPQLETTTCSVEVY